MPDEKRLSQFETWAIVEIMGHRRIGAFVREVTIAGHGFFRLDLPGPKPDEVAVTQYYPPASVYCLTPCTEETARAQAASSGQYEPFTVFDARRMLEAHRNDPSPY